MDSSFILLVMDMPDMAACESNVFRRLHLHPSAGTRDHDGMILSKGDSSAVDNVLDHWTIAYGQSGALPPVSLSSSRQREWD